MSEIASDLNKLDLNKEKAWTNQQFVDKHNEIPLRHSSVQLQKKFPCKSFKKWKKELGDSGLLLSRQ